MQNGQKSTLKLVIYIITLNMEVQRKLSVPVHVHVNVTHSKKMHLLQTTPIHQFDVRDAIYMYMYHKCTRHEQTNEDTSPWIINCDISAANSKILLQPPEDL